MESPAAQLAGFVAKFDLALAAQIRTCRRALRKTLPAANEFVYDAFSFLVIGYSTTLPASDTIVSLTANARASVWRCITGSVCPTQTTSWRGYALKTDSCA